MSAPGAYGIRECAPDAPGAILTCGTCGRSWNDDLTPSGRCPWEDFHLQEEDLPTALPYAGTEGSSGSAASHDRAREEATSGAARYRQERIRHALDAHEEHGATWVELGRDLGIHHGQATGSLSAMHKEGQICRLLERRGRSSVYVLPEYVNGRQTAPHGRRARDLSDEEIIDLYWAATGDDDWAIDEQVMIAFARAVIERLR